MPRPNPDAREAQETAAFPCGVCRVCVSLPFPVISGTTTKVWKIPHDKWDPQKMKIWNIPPILQNEDLIRFVHTTNPSKWRFDKICTYPILQNEDLKRFVHISNFRSINAPTKKEQQQRIHPFFVVKKQKSFLHGLRFTGPRPWMNGTVIHGQVEVCFPNPTSRFFRMGGTSVKCHDFLFQKKVW